MTEPRTRPRRPNHNPTSTSGNQTNNTTFPTTDLSDLLYAFGSSPPPLPSTLNVLDEILTDFIIETCHLASISASYSRRAKLKVEDFKFVLRHDEALLGRGMEQIWRDKRIKDQRRQVELDGGAGAGGGLQGLEAVAHEGGVGGDDLKKGPGRGRGKRKRKRAEGEADAGEEDRAGKRVAS